MRPRHMFLFLLCAASAALSPAARAAEPSPDQALALEAAHGNYGEIKAGNLAKTSATDAGVRQFAEMMVTDHTMAGIELSNAANGAGLTVPEETDAKHQEMLDKLTKLKGLDFDKQYMNDMVAGHKSMEDLLEKISKSATSEYLKNWAARTLPTVQGHLKRAEEVRSKLR